jgi:hypothetical protein
MGTGSRSLRSVPVPISPVLTRGVGKGGQARAEYVPSQSPFADSIKQPWEPYQPRVLRAPDKPPTTPAHADAPARRQPHALPQDAQRITCHSGSWVRSALSP